MNDFWLQKRVLVTGGSGFVGSFVVDKLKALGVQEIIAPRKAEFDLRERDEVQELLAENKPDLIIHLAATVGGIGANRLHPAEFFYDNLMMGIQLLHESWKANVEKVVIIGTVCAYPKFASVPFKEDEIWNGYPEETNAPYGLAKKMLLVQSEAYRQQYNYNSIFLLPTNLYGPRDNFDPASSHVIPALIRKCHEAKERGDHYVEVWGDGSPTREFLYVDDAVEGILLASERYNSSSPVNLGSSFEISIKDLVKTIAKLVGFEGEIRFDTSKPNGQPRRKLDVSKAKREFGFESKTTFEEGLKKTIEWYRESLRVSQP